MRLATRTDPSNDRLAAAGTGYDQAVAWKPRIAATALAWLTESQEVLLAAVLANSRTCLQHLAATRTQGREGVQGVVALASVWDRLIRALPTM